MHHYSYPTSVIFWSVGKSQQCDMMLQWRRHALNIWWPENISQLRRRILLDCWRRQVSLAEVVKKLQKTILWSFWTKNQGPEKKGERTLLRVVENGIALVGPTFYITVYAKTQTTNSEQLFPVYTCASAYSTSLAIQLREGVHAKRFSRWYA